MIHLCVTHVNGLHVCVMDGKHSISTCSRLALKIHLCVTHMNGSHVCVMDGNLVLVHAVRVMDVYV